MKLVTRVVEKELDKHPLNSQRNLGFNQEVLVEYYNPCGKERWLITESKKQPNGKYLFYGYCFVNDWEWGEILQEDLEKTYLTKNKITRNLDLKPKATVVECLNCLNEEDSAPYYSEKVPKDADLENDERKIEYFLSYEDGDCDAAGYSDYKRVENMAIDYLADSVDNNVVAENVVYVIKDVFHRTKRGTKYYTEQDYDDCKTVTEVKWVRGRIKACKIDEKLTSDSNIKRAQKLTEAFKLNDDNILVPLTSKEEDELIKSYDDDCSLSLLRTNYKGHCPYAYYEYDNDEGQNKGLYFYDDTLYDDDSVYDSGTAHYGIWHEFDVVQDGFESVIESRYGEDEEEKPKAVKMVAYCVPETEESFKAHSGDPIVDKTKKPFLLYEYTWDDKENVWKLTAYEGDGAHPKFDPKLKGDRYELDWEEATEIEEDLDEKLETHDTLNSAIFEGDDTLKPEVKEGITKIVDDYINAVKESGIKVPVQDIVLVGSNASYNYTNKSDLDIHIIIDSKKLPEEELNLYSLIYDLYRGKYNGKHNIVVKKIPAEIYVEMDATKTKSNGVYSIMNDAWVKKPSRASEEGVDDSSVDALFEKEEKKYFALLKKYSDVIEIDESTMEDNDLDENLLLLEDINELRKTYVGRPTEHNPNKISEETFDRLLACDPTYTEGQNINPKYIKYIINGWLNGNIVKADLGHLKDALKVFNEEQYRIKDPKYKNIFTFTLPKPDRENKDRTAPLISTIITDYVFDENNLKEKTKSRQAKDVAKEASLQVASQDEHMITWYQGDTWEMYTPLDWPTSIGLGKPAVWCTAADYNSSWKDRWFKEYSYKSMGIGSPLFIIGKKNPNRDEEIAKLNPNSPTYVREKASKILENSMNKYQYHFASNQFNDANNQTVPGGWLNNLTRLDPKLVDVFLNIYQHPEEACGELHVDPKWVVNGMEKYVQDIIDQLWIRDKAQDYYEVSGNTLTIKEAFVTLQDHHQLELLKNYFKTISNSISTLVILGGIKDPNNHNLETIASSYFNFRMNITSLSLSPNIKVLSDNCFCGLNLSEVDLSNVDEIEVGAFRTSKLKKVTLRADTPYVDIMDTGEGAFGQYTIYNIDYYIKGTNLSIGEETVFMGERKYVGGMKQFLNSVNKDKIHWLDGEPAGWQDDPFCLNLIKGKGETSPQPKSSSQPTTSTNTETKEQ